MESGRITHYKIVESAIMIHNTDDGVTAICTAQRLLGSIMIQTASSKAQGMLRRA